MFISKRFLKHCATTIFIGSAFSSIPALAGTWTTENGLEGMDSVHIYEPTTPPAHVKASPVVTRVI